MRFIRLLNIVAFIVAASSALSTITGTRLAAKLPPADPLPADVVRLAAEAHASLMGGDLATYRKRITLSDDFTFMGPFGGETRGAAQFSDARWAEIAGAFRNGRDASFTLVQSYYSPGLAVLVGIERANVEVAGLPAQDWSLRVTLVFKRAKGGKWLLAHRHADPLVRAIPLETAAGLADETVTR